MKFGLSPPKKYLDTTATPKELADKMTAIGLEVEDLQDLSDSLKGFVLAEIKTVAPHPNADRLHI